MLKFACCCVVFNNLDHAAAAGGGASNAELPGGGREGVSGAQHFWLWWCALLRAQHIQHATKDNRQDRHWSGGGVGEMGGGSAKAEGMKGGEGESVRVVGEEENVANIKVVVCMDVNVVGNRRCLGRWF